LRAFYRAKKRNALIRPDGDPRRSALEQQEIHEQPAQPAIAVEEWMDGYKLQMHHDRPCN
jgi:hypothetical protein